MGGFCMSRRRASMSVLSTVAVLVAAAAVFVAPGAAAAAVVDDPAALVNPLLGTAGAGNTFPGADAPFGMVQWSPDTTSKRFGGGYKYADSAISGFSLTHVSGVGCDIMGDWPILPTTGAVAATANVGFSHAGESASPGSYAVTLANAVRTELTATTRSGMGRFTFPATTQANLLFKTTGGASVQGPATFTVVDSTHITGSVVSGKFCSNADTTYTTYFDVVFDRPFTSSTAFTGGTALTFDTSAAQVVQAKVGLSFMSVANAAANRTAENAGWDFSATRDATRAAWNELLGKIQIGGGTGAQRTTFYTALYHSLLHPNVVSDVNGQYRGFDQRTHTLSPGQSAQYSNFSNWDSYRTQSQLMALVAPAQASDSAQSMVNAYAQGGVLPKWALNDGETFVMVGDPAAPVLAGYYAFGARNFDTAAAKAAMVKQGTDFSPARPGIDYLAGIGYLPSDGTWTCCRNWGPVATQLEYNTADFAISAFAGALGDTVNQSRFRNRAGAWRNVLNPTSGLMQPRLLDGTWKADFDPVRDDHGFVEAPSWTYTGMVPFDLRGLADAKGGNAAMAAYLDHVLAGFKGAGDHADLSNEPSINLPWEYDYVGQPWKTQKTVRDIQNQLWTADPAVWATGNDDLGAMSAWYVWSALGMYPMTPGTADLALGSPLFTTATVALAGGGEITINAPAAATGAPYVQALSLDGATWNNAYLPPSFALTGGTLDVTLGTTANTSWATAASSAPPSYPSPGGEGPLLPQPGPTGRISSAIAGKCVDVVQSGTANGTGIDSYACNGSAAQQWTVLGDGSLRAFGKCVDVPNGAATNGTQVQLWNCNGSNPQRWRHDPVTGALRNPITDKCLDIPDSSTANGALLRIWTCNASNAQKWTMPASATGLIGAGVGAKCLDVAGGATANGTKVDIFTCAAAGTEKQEWTILGDGSARALHKCLDVTSGGTVNGTLVRLYTCNATGSQQWTWNSGTGTLTNPQSGKCLDVPDSSTADGTQVRLWTCNGTSAQRWTLP
ncbi:lectin [Actinoplanes sp. NPDC051494]|uniref:lectin n=1 Tax=Actinoplanes sp. NPDC051494 TaxID=3363907 RepID=UPI0037A475FB